MIDFGSGKIGRQQKRRPVDAVEAHNLLADHVYVGRPVTRQLFLVYGIVGAEADRRHVVGQRIQPHIDDVLGIARHRYAPLERGAADRQIAQSAAHERDHLVAPRLGTNEVGMLGVILQQPLFHGRQLEEIIFLVNRFGRPPALGTRRARADDIDVELVEHAILAAVRTFVDVAALLQSGEHGLHAAHVPGLGGADEVVVGDLHAVPQTAELARDLVDKLLRRAAGGGGRALDLLPVLVGAGEEPGVHAHHALAPGDGIAHHGGVRVPDVRPRIDVINRSGDVELFGLGFIHSVGPGTSGWLPASPSSAGRDARRQCAGNLHIRARTAKPCRSGWRPSCAPRPTASRRLRDDAPGRSASHDASGRPACCSRETAARAARSSCSGRARTVSSVPGRFFFICTGVVKTSSAPSASACSTM